MKFINLIVDVTVWTKTSGYGYTGIFSSGVKNKIPYYSKISPFRYVLFKWLLNHNY